MAFFLGARRGVCSRQDWLPEGADALRERWAGYLARDEDQLAGIRGALRGELAVFDDVRRPDEYRQHTGRETKLTRRANFRASKRRELSEG